MKQDWLISGWRDRVSSNEIRDKRHVLSIANLNQFQEIVSCLHFWRTTDVVLVFLSSSDSIFYVSNKVCARLNQKLHHKLQKNAKKCYWKFFFRQKLSKKVKQIKMPRDSLWAFFKNCATFRISPAWRRSNSTSIKQIKDIQQMWVFFAINHLEEKWKFCIFKKFRALEVEFFGKFFVIFGKFA